MRNQSHLACTRFTSVSAPRGGRPAGYTLLELLLVIGIVMVIAGATTPAVLGLIKDYRLKEGTEAVRMALANTRVDAIEASSTYQFRFEPGGRRYLAIPVDPNVEMLPAPVVGQAASTGPPPVAGGTNAQSSSPLGHVETGLLPPELTFQTAPAVAGTTQDSETPTADADWTAALERLPNAADVGAGQWSPPIFFRADGTASDAAFDLVDQKGNGSRVVVRELTGEIAVQPREQKPL